MSCSRAPAWCLACSTHGDSEGDAGTPPSPRGLEAPSCLPPAGEPDSREGTRDPGLLVGAAGGKPGYRATPRGPRRPRPPASPAPCHPCSGPHQRQTLGSWSMRRKTGKYSDQREGITVQKKPVQPERAPARPDRGAPCAMRPPPARVVETLQKLAWTGSREPEQALEPARGGHSDNSRAGCLRGASGCRPQNGGIPRSPIPGVSYTEQAASEGVPLPTALGGSPACPFTPGLCAHRSLWLHVPPMGPWLPPNVLSCLKTPWGNPPDPVGLPGPVSAHDRSAQPQTSGRPDSGRALQGWGAACPSTQTNTADRTEGGLHTGSAYPGLRGAVRGQKLKQGDVKRKAR